MRKAFLYFEKSFIKIICHQTFSFYAKIFADTFGIFKTFRKHFLWKAKQMFVKFSRKYENEHFRFNPNISVTWQKILFNF
jgi:hypothetical protein